MASPASSEQRFERLSHVMHERLTFSPVKISHSLSTVFEESVYHRLDQRRVLAEFEGNGGKPCPEISEISEEMVYDKGHKGDVAYLALSG